MRRAVLAVAASAVGVVAGAPAAGAATVLVSLEPGARPPAHARFVTRIAGISTWRLDAPRSGVARLERRPGVLAAEVSRPLRAAQYRGFCAAGPPASVDQTIPSIVDAVGLAPLSGPPIAVLDTGVDPATPELAGRVLEGDNALAGGTDTHDPDSHGTGVASVAAGAPGLVQGVSPGSRIVPITIFDADGTSSAAVLVKGIGDAVARGAKVINISGASPAGQASAADDRVVKLAIDAAVDAGAEVVAPTGNDGTDEAQVPAIYPHVLVAGATDATGSRAGFSNTGPSTDLLALGDGMTLPAPKAICPSGYAQAQGTSFAAPAVAGAAALLAAARPALSATQRDNVLRATASNHGAWDPAAGFGVLDVAKALAAPKPAFSDNEVDDDVFWVTGDTPIVSPARRRGGASDSVNALKDPADVRRVQLRAGELLKATLAGPKKAGQLALTLWDPKTPRFGIAANLGDHVEAIGVQDGTRILMSDRVKRAGTYYLSVTTTQDAAQNPAPLPYTLSVSSSARRPRRPGRKA